MAAAAEWFEPSDRADGVARRLEARSREQAPLRRALAALAERFVRRRAWERLGFARCDSEEISVHVEDALSAEEAAMPNAHLARRFGIGMHDVKARSVLGAVLEQGRGDRFAASDQDDGLGGRGAEEGPDDRFEQAIQLQAFPVESSFGLSSIPAFREKGKERGRSRAPPSAGWAR